MMTSPPTRGRLNAAPPLRTLADMPGEWLTTAEVAALRGVPHSTVKQMITRGKLPATKFGRNNMVHVNDVHKVTQRRVGRPSKPKAGAAPGEE